MVTFAHISDPHVNRLFHPSHLSKLRWSLEDALLRGANHIVISGDLSSDADERDLKDCRKLFAELGILREDKLTLVIGNHDIYGGPHLAEDLFGFPSRCRRAEYDDRVMRFADIFAETFPSALRPLGRPFPFLKMVSRTAILGLNSVARHSHLKNPFGSNGRVADDELAAASLLLELPAATLAHNRIAVLHHHFIDEPEGGSELPTSNLIRKIEGETLKLRHKSNVVKSFIKGKVDLVLHGHVHVTSQYKYQGLRVSNGGGAVMPLLPGQGYAYNLHNTGENSVVSERRQVPIPATFDQWKVFRPKAVSIASPIAARA